MDIKSPFTVSEDDIRVLEQNEGFRVVRAYLLNQENHSYVSDIIHASVCPKLTAFRFCPSHSSLSQTIQQTFILHRDILHSLLLPLLQIRSQAALFAAHTLPYQSQIRSPRSPFSPRSPVDLELAFRGAARGAFCWLQCFVAEERDWCSTQGCPACVVLKVLHSEPFIRIVVAACRLSTHLRGMLQGNSHGENVQRSGSAIPEFGFWLSAVHQAVSEDDFWGLHFWGDIEARAEDLELGVKDLIRQCCEISSPSPTAQSYQRRGVTFGHMPSSKPTSPVKTGSLVKRQLRLQQEEQEWMRKIIEACWLALVQEAAYKRRKVSATAKIRPGALRIRSLTT